MRLWDDPNKRYVVGSNPTREVPQFMKGHIQNAPKSVLQKETHW